MSKRVIPDITGEFEVFRAQLLEVNTPIAEATLRDRRKGRDFLSHNELLAIDSLDHFSEIVNSVDRLEEIAILLRHSPPARWGISKPSFLQFLIESYLQELFILRERLLAFARWLSKQLRKSKPEASKELSNLNGRVAASFKGRADARSRYVHSRRYSNDGLLNAFIYQLIASNKRSAKHESEAAMWKAAAEDAYLLSRKEFNQTVAAERIAIKAFLDYYFGVLNPLVFKHLLR